MNDSCAYDPFLELLPDIVRGADLPGQADKSLLSTCPKNGGNFNRSKALGLQVIATTHSLSLLELAFKSSVKQFIEVIPLQKKSGRVSLLPVSDTYEKLKANLEASVLPKAKASHKRVTVVVEDKVAIQFFQALVRNRTNFSLKVAGSGHLLENLAALELEELSSVLFVLDGDFRVQQQSGGRNRRNLVVLPGNSCPERLIFDFISELSDDDEFWEVQGRGYNQQVAFRDVPRPPLSSDDHKQWYKAQKRNWTTEADVFKFWASRNRDVCNQFVREFLIAVRRTAPGVVPDDVFNKIESLY